LDCFRNSELQRRVGSKCSNESAVVWDADGANEPSNGIAGEAEVDNEWTLTWTFHLSAHAAIFKKIVQ
jgi:hypothetical protein